MKASTLHLIDRLQFPWLTASIGQIVKQVLKKFRMAYNIL